MAFWLKNAILLGADLVLRKLSKKLGEKERSFFGGFRGGLSADGVQDEVDDSVSKENNDEAKDSIENGIFGIGDFLAVAAGDDVADTAPN